MRRNADSPALAARRAPAAVAVLLALLVAPAGVRADAQDAGPQVRPFGAVAKDAGSAFKPLKLPSAKQIDKDLTPRLPQGIVIDSKPFDALIAGLREPFAEQLALRDNVVRELAAHPGAKAGKLLRTAVDALAKDDAELSSRIDGVQDTYAEVFGQGYMESSESERRTRKSAATLIPFYRGLLREADTLRWRMAETLATFREGEGREWLLSSLQDREPVVRAVAAEALGLLLASKPASGDAADALRRALATDASAAVRQTALCALLRAPLVDVRDAIVAALADPAWDVRAIAIAACVQGEIVEAAGPLIEALGKETGRLRTDIDDALFVLLGVRYYADAALWRQWWNDNATVVAEKAKKQLESGAYATPLGPPETWDDRDAGGGAAAEGDGERARSGATSDFYGITTRSRRVLFVVDISLSMDSPAQAVPPVTGVSGGPYAAPEGKTKLDIAKWQLHKAIHELPDDSRFDVVVYSESYALWMPEMAEASPKSKKKAHGFVDAIHANGTTNICDSLDAAFEIAGLERGAGDDGYAADTIFLLSDGDPNRGRIADLTRLLPDVLRRTARARLVIHAVGIGEVSGSSFLRDLAERTGGRYVGFE